MKILVDEDIPYANELFSRFGDVTAVPGRQISMHLLNDIDALIIRSTTKIDKLLLSGKKIKFVGTATAGIDHVDEKWLSEMGISFSSAPGCNAIAVVEYVFSTLLALSERDNFILKDLTVGIIGVGNVGRQLQRRLNALNVRTLLCDPPRADNNDSRGFCSLDELVGQCDVLTFHTPLSKSGPYKSLRMMDEIMIRRLKPGAILINSCRGPVIDNKALLKCLESGQNLNVVLDVWEREPNLSVALLQNIDIATAHIAGHSLEGKIRGITSIFESYSQFIGNPQSITIDTLLPEPKFSCIKLHGSLNQETLKKLVHLVYDVRRDDALLRKIAGIPGEFDKLRKHYPERREWSSLHVICDNENSAFLLRELGFNALYRQI